MGLGDLFRRLTGDKSKEGYQSLVDHIVDNSEQLANMRAERVQLDDKYKTRWQRWKGRRVYAYYDRQVELLQHLVDDAKLMGDPSVSRSKYGAVEEESSYDNEALLNSSSRGIPTDRRLAWMTVVEFFVIMAAVVAATLISGSASVATCIIDSLTDVACSIAIYASQYGAANSPRLLYPYGRATLEQILVLLIALIMFGSGAAMLIQAIIIIVQDSGDPNVDTVTIIILCLVIVVKSCMYLYCSKSSTPAAKMLQLNFLVGIITNTVALTMGLLGTYVDDNADCIGAACVSLFIMYSWTVQGNEQVPLLVGRAASSQHQYRALSCILSHPGVSRSTIEDMTLTHRSTNCDLCLDVGVKAGTKVEDASALCASVRTRVLRVPFVASAVVAAVPISRAGGPTRKDSSSSSSSSSSSDKVVDVGKADETASSSKGILHEVLTEYPPHEALTDFPHID